MVHLEVTKWTCSILSCLDSNLLNSKSQNEIFDNVSRKPQLDLLWIQAVQPNRMKIKLIALLGLNILTNKDITSQLNFLFNVLRLRRHSFTKFKRMSHMFKVDYPSTKSDSRFFTFQMSMTYCMSHAVFLC